MLELKFSLQNIGLVHQYQVHPRPLLFEWGQQAARLIFE